MTQRHKSFQRKPKITVPVSFDIDGEQFTCVPQIPGAVLLDFIGDADSDDGGRAAEALIGFLENVVIQEERERFIGYIRSPETLIEIELLADICEYLVGEYAQRPTQPPTASADGPSTTGTGPTVPSSAMV